MGDELITAFGFARSHDAIASQFPEGLIGGFQQVAGQG